mmetsp:Transcript_4497/g.6742  ORF Transcript_4497/g.6742 Transcript_4497/m.6742 type:complete len:241 (-) Transcript_4497:66-788(-)|eukprot:CAMPEP_0113936804 /NCGR_PEP_ID=MMETSP1339-20121228/3597_1 /TAXON_ID=94617 /ORGANISM="Fibrocapsa japonica" /LENGTH=240 /DNA_ID=CAMNT_0000939363 /DNA_START=13 /DNA_END=735 /DNA_ORIENTATION=- /assembly_acc=CAM_ASM_000762
MADRPSKKQKTSQLSNEASTPKEGDFVVRNVPTNLLMSKVTQLVGDYLAEFLSTVVGCPYVLEVESEDGREYAIFSHITDQGNVVAAKLRLVPQCNANTATCKGFGFLNLDIQDIDANTVIGEFSSWKQLVYCRNDGVEKTLRVELVSQKTGKSSVTQEMKAENREKMREGLAALGERLVELVRANGGSLPIKDWAMKDRKYLNEKGKVRNAKPKHVVEAVVPEGLVCFDNQTQMFNLVT